MVPLDAKKEILVSMYYHDSDCVEFSRCAAFLRLQEGADLDLGVARGFLYNEKKRKKTSKDRSN